MFRASPFRNDPFFRNDPLFSSSFFRPLSSPFSSLFDFPPVSAPLYYLTEEEDEPRRTSSSRKGQQPQQWEEKYNESGSKSSPSNQQMTTTGKKEDRMEKRRTNPRSLISPFFNTALAPYTAQMPTMDMKVDMFSTPTAYCVHAAVPGLKKEDINITVQDGVLTIEAERREEKKIRRSLPSPSSSQQQQQQQQQGQTQPMESKEAGGEERRAQEKMGDISFTEKTDKSEQQMDTSEDVNYHHVESFYGRVTRSVQLPDDARLDELTAKYEDGVIKIEVPRTHDEKKQQRKIAIQ